ncbi:MAG: beta-ketoacyl synthase chain length factor [Colwellia sp.]
MTVYIKSIRVWLQGEDEPNRLTLWANNKLCLEDDFIAPKPQYYPKGQLRRLSPFSKVALHCLDMPQALTQNLPLIFASQHGDLAKTVKLIKDAALGDDLSPTQFALSVHNATTGLFSIATSNTAPTTTISAGKNTFAEGLIEASMQSQLENTSVIYTYCDFDVPAAYSQFEARKPARCISMVITSQEDKANESLAQIDIILNNKKTNRVEKSGSDVSLDFIRYLYLQSNDEIAGEKHSLSLGFS